MAKRIFIVNNKGVFDGREPKQTSCCAPKQTSCCEPEKKAAKSSCCEPAPKTSCCGTARG